MNKQYRGMTIGDKKFVYGWYFRLGPDGNKSHYILPEENACWYSPVLTSHDEETITGFVEVIPKSVGQSTGLKDKDKKEVYASDKITTGEGYNYQVKWSDEIGGWYFMGLGTNDYGQVTKSMTYQEMKKYANPEIEIIGTIHDKDFEK